MLYTLPETIMEVEYSLFVEENSLAGAMFHVTMFVGWRVYLHYTSCFGAIRYRYPI